MFFKTAAVLAALIAAAPSAFAHRNHDHSPKETIEVQLDEAGISSDSLRALMDEAHHSIELEENGGFLKQYADKFRFKKISLNAFRWYAQHRHQPEVANAAANIALMLLASHTIETVGGLSLATYAAAHDWGWIGKSVMMTIGVTVTVPGLDPLCLLLVGAYGKWPAKMNQLLSKPRIFIVKSFTKAQSLAGVQEGWLAANVAEWRKARFLSRLEKWPGVIQTESVDGHRVFHIENRLGERALSLEFHAHDDAALELESVTVSSSSRGFDRGDWVLNGALKIFGANIYDAVSDIAAAAGDAHALEHLGYVSGSAEIGAGVRHVRLKSDAFPFLKLSDRDLGCEAILLSRAG